MGYGFSLIFLIHQFICYEYIGHCIVLARECACVSVSVREVLDMRVCRSCDQHIRDTNRTRCGNIMKLAHTYVIPKQVNVAIVPSLVQPVGVVDTIAQNGRYFAISQKRKAAEA